MHSALTVVALLGSLSTTDICTTQSCVVYAETATDLYQIDPVTLSQTHLCPFNGISGAVNDIAVTPQGQVYALTSTELYTFDVGSCQGSLVTSVSNLGSNFNGMTFLLDGRLIAVDDQGTVAQIDTSSGSVTQVGSYGGNYGSSGDLVALSNGQIYATARDNSGAAGSDVLVTLDSSTFHATAIAEIGYSSIYGLGYWAGVLYGFDSAGDVLTIDPSTAQAQVAISNPSLDWYGAGTTPLAPVTCTNACTSGATQCSGSGSLQTCTMQSSGCYGWATSSCGSGNVCQGGACVPSCSSTCFPFTSRCADSGHSQSCEAQSNGCFDWVTSACPTDQICSSGDCVPNCQNACSPGQTQCSGNTVQSCQQQSNGCYAWANSQACPGTELCAAGQCVLSCTDACNAGATQCSGSFVQTCATGSAGCTEWQNTNDCGALGCGNGACCACQEGDTRCAGSGREVCTLDTSTGATCPTWTSEACPSNACLEGACLTACTPSNEFNPCGDGAQCAATQGGDYCVVPLPDGGYDPAYTGTGSTNSGSTGSGAGAGAGAGSGSGSASAGTNAGAGSVGGTGSGAGAGAGAGSGAGGTSASSGDSAASGSTGASAGATTAGRKPASVSTTGCGCNAAPADLALELAFGLALALRLRRRR